jgi:hypothetical protein
MWRVLGTLRRGILREELWHGNREGALVAEMEAGGQHPPLGLDELSGHAPADGSTDRRG